MSRPAPIVLGTVQLGLPYGRRAGQASMSTPEAFAILDQAWEMGIRAFDVAEAYGTACTRLGTWLTSRQHSAVAQVITKVRIDDASAIASRLAAALGPFEGVSDLTLLTHGAAVGAMWEQIRRGAAAAGASAGQSVYEADEVRTAASLPGVVRIQAPGNIFDPSALSARGDSLVPLDIRSVYLQGVLLESPDAAELRAPHAAMLASAVQSAARDASLPASSLLLAVVLGRLRAGDRVVLGVDRPEELAPILEAAEIPDDTVQSFEAQVLARAPGPYDRQTLDPRRWSRVAELTPPSA